MLNEIVLAIEVWQLVLVRNGNDLLLSVGVFTAAVKVLQKQVGRVQFKSGGTFIGLSLNLGYPLSLNLIYLNISSHLLTRTGICLISFHNILIISPCFPDVSLILRLKKSP